MTYDPRNRSVKMDLTSILHPHPSISEETLEKALDAMKRAMREDIRKASPDEPIERRRTTT